MLNLNSLLKPTSASSFLGKLLKWDNNKIFLVQISVMLTSMKWNELKKSSINKKTVVGTIYTLNKRKYAKQKKNRRENSKKKKYINTYDKDVLFLCQVVLKKAYISPEKRSKISIVIKHINQLSQQGWYSHTNSLLSTSSL